MWMIHLHIFSCFTNKKNQGDVLEQDIELCLFCSFTVTTAGKKKTFFVNSLYFTILLLVAFLFFADT